MLRVENVLQFNFNSFLSVSTVVYFNNSSWFDSELDCRKSILLIFALDASFSQPTIPASGSSSYSSNKAKPPSKSNSSKNPEIASVLWLVTSRSGGNSKSWSLWLGVLSILLSLSLSLSLSLFSVSSVSSTLSLSSVSLPSISLSFSFVLVGG